MALGHRVIKNNDRRAVKLTQVAEAIFLKRSPRTFSFQHSHMQNLSPRSFVEFYVPSANSTKLRQAERLEKGEKPH